MLPVGHAWSTAQELACSFKSLSIRSYNDLLCQCVCGFDKRQTGGHSLQRSL